MGQPTNYLLGGQAGLLGADPELYRQQLLQQEQARIGAMPAQNQLAATLGGLLGRGVSNVAQDRGFFEVTNPVLQKLTSIQSVYNRAMQDSDPNDPMSFYKNLQTGFANAGLGQQALMATQELRKVEEQGIKTESAKLDFYAKFPDKLQTDIAMFRAQGNDTKANELSGYLGKITAKEEMTRQKDILDLAVKNSNINVNNAQIEKIKRGIDDGSVNIVQTPATALSPATITVFRNGKQESQVTVGKTFDLTTPDGKGGKKKGLTQEEVDEATIGQRTPTAAGVVATAQPGFPAAAGSSMPGIDAYPVPEPYRQYSPPTVQMGR
jgi:hypothetical protein